MTEMNNTIDDSLQIHTMCAGKKCESPGTHFLRILYLNKYGWFCDSCRNNLISDCLIVEEVQNTRSTVNEQ